MNQLVRKHQTPYVSYMWTVCIVLWCKCNQKLQSVKQNSSKMHHNIVQNSEQLFYQQLIFEYGYSYR
jgi:hypothetical protein